MSVLYRISEDCHGDLAITETLERAIDFLINESWISEDTEIYLPTYETEINLYEYVNNIDENLSVSEWLKELTRGEFNTFFDGQIYIEKLNLQNGIIRLR